MVVFIGIGFVWLFSGIITIYLAVSIIKERKKSEKRGDTEPIRRTNYK